jgi:hypothetical protein
MFPLKIGTETKLIENPNVYDSFSIVLAAAVKEIGL